MNYGYLRLKLRFKRELLGIIGYKPHNFISIYRAEKKPINFAEKVENYSQSVFQEFYDPRSERITGHMFNARDIFKLTNVIVEPNQGLIYSQEGRLVSESTNWTTSNLYESFPWNPRKITKKISLNEVINLTSNAFGHWLVHDLGAIIYLIEKFPNSPILVYKNAPRFVFELLQKLDREVILCEGPVQVNSVLMVAKQNDGGWMHPKDLQILEKFSKQFKPLVQDSNERIYASRRLLKRSPKNEKDVENLFKNFNFKILRLEEVNFIEEINMLKSTKVLAGIHGSWQFNCIWMNKGTEILDIVNENYWTELIHRVCAMKNINYKWYIYPGNYGNPVDIKNLEKTLVSISS